MALSIFYKSGQISERHVPFEDQTFDLEDIKYIQADGHELQAIRSLFAFNVLSIPIAATHVPRWPEPWASLILMNLTNKPL